MKELFDLSNKFTGSFIIENFDFQRLQTATFSVYDEFSYSYILSGTDIFFEPYENSFTYAETLLIEDLFNIEYKYQIDPLTIIITETTLAMGDYCDYTEPTVLIFTDNSTCKVTYIPTYAELFAFNSKFKFKLHWFEPWSSICVFGGLFPFMSEDYSYDSIVTILAPIVTQPNIGFDIDTEIHLSLADKGLLPFIIGGIQ